MTFRTIPDVVRAFCFNDALTHSILDELLIIGNLQGRKIRQILPHSGWLGHLIHRVRYCFNLFHYRDSFNEAVRGYLRKATVVIRRQPTPPKAPKRDEPPASAAAPAVPAQEPVPLIPPQDTEPLPLPAPSPLPPDPTAIVTAPPPAPQQPALSEATEQFLQQVHSKLGPQPAELWRILFTHCLHAHSEDHCHQFTIRGKSHFLHIQQPLNIHMNPLNADRQPAVEGGLILSLGTKGVVEMEFDNGVIHFKKGVACHAKKAGSVLEATICQFLSDSEGVNIKAKIVLLSVNIKETYASIKETWSHRARVLPHNADFKAVLS